MDVTELKCFRQRIAPAEAFAKGGDREHFGGVFIPSP